MSHDQGLPWARHHSSRPHQRPSLDRPSLFAGMESDEDDAPERVRILSTLAANRPPSKRASPRRSRARRHSWQFKALLGLMALGIVGLLAGFVMVLSQGHPPTLTEQSGATTPTGMQAGPSVRPAPAPAATPRAAAPDEAPLASTSAAPQTAVIEELPPSPREASPTSLPHLAHAPGSHTETREPAPGRSHRAAVAQAPVPAAAPLVEATGTEHIAHHPTAAPRADKAAPRTPRVEARPAAPETKRGQDADVALLEAMFTHTRPARADGDKRGRCGQHPQASGCAAAR